MFGWFKKKSPLIGLFRKRRGKCDLCGSPLDENHGHIFYQPSDTGAVSRLNLCSVCISKIENDYDEFTFHLRKWRKER